MWPEEAQLVLKRTVEFSSLAARPQARHEAPDPSLTAAGTIGGIIYRARLAWMTNSARLDIFSLDTGLKVAAFDFDAALRTRGAKVACVCEIHTTETVASCILAVGVQLEPNGGKLCLVSVQGSCVLGAIQVLDRVTSCNFVPSELSQSLLNIYDSCVAIGTDQGHVILLDLCFKEARRVLKGEKLSSEGLAQQQCHVVFANMDLTEAAQHHMQARNEEIYFGIQLEVFESSGPVLAIMTIPSAMTLVVGFGDGRMILYDLESLQDFHMAYPPSKNEAPLESLCYVEPADDPRACIYVWAFHRTEGGAIAVMHSVMFGEKFSDETETYYDKFTSCVVKLTMPIFEKSSFPVACHSITKEITQEEGAMTLCLLAWGSDESESHVMVFDLNQWYKEQMPETADWRRLPCFTATFPVGKESPVDVLLDRNSLKPFGSIQRPEEHFYPNSLSFDIVLLHKNACKTAYWPGLQPKLLKNLDLDGARALLEPHIHFKNFLAAALQPHYQDFNLNGLVALETKREFLLTLSLEYNCVRFLKSCACSVADGSHIGHENGVALSTITEWIWARAKALKETSNELCVPLFDYSGRRIDYGVQKSLTRCTRQLRVINELLEMICTTCRAYIPDGVQKKLETQLDSIQRASDYQEAIQWLLNVGLLPEGMWRSESRLDRMDEDDEEFLVVPYPYFMIVLHYERLRAKFSDDTRRSHFVYIDEFIRNECGQLATPLWGEHEEANVYPPPSLQSLLRILLLSDVPLESKYILFVYVFMDLNAALGDGQYAKVAQNLIKFPVVFKLDPAVIKITQSFWYLDRGDLEMAVEDLISPLAQGRGLKEWQRDFLIKTLLKQDAPNLALRVLKAPGLPVDAALEMETLLTNDLVAEAFNFQRAKGDTALLNRFFEGAIRIKRRDLLLNLSLNEREAKTLVDFLEQTELPLAENLHFVHLLRRAEFVEAVGLMDRLMKYENLRRGMNLDTPSDVLSIYHSTLDPTTRHITFLAYSNARKLELKAKHDSLEPLSTSLIQRELDPTLGLYQRSILSIKDADPKEQLERQVGSTQPFIRRSDLDFFSFTHQTETTNVVHPVVVNETVRKRRAEEERRGGDEPFLFTQQPKKRARMDDSMPRKSFRDFDTSIFDRFKPDFKPNFRSFSDTQTTPEKQKMVRSPPATLTTPIVKRVHRDESPPPTRFTPHSILKSTGGQRRSTSPMSMASRRSVDSERSSVRFVEPTTNAAAATAETSFDSSMELRNSVMEELDTTKEEDTTGEIFYSPDNSGIAASFLADTPAPRPPIRGASAASSSDEKGKEKTISPAVEEEKEPTAIEGPESSSTPIVAGALTKTRSDQKKPLSRLVLEASVKRQLRLNEIFGDEAKTSDESEISSVLQLEASDHFLTDDSERPKDQQVGDTSVESETLGLSLPEDNPLLQDSTMEAQDAEVAPTEHQKPKSPNATTSEEKLEIPSAETSSTTESEESEPQTRPESSVSSRSDVAESGSSEEPVTSLSEEDENEEDEDGYDPFAKPPTDDEESMQPEMEEYEEEPFSDYEDDEEEDFDEQEPPKEQQQPEVISLDSSSDEEGVESDAHADEMTKTADETHPDEPNLNQALVAEQISDPALQETNYLDIYGQPVEEAKVPTHSLNAEDISSMLYDQMDVEAQEETTGQGMNEAAFVVDLDESDEMPTAAFQVSPDDEEGPELPADEPSVEIVEAAKVVEPESVTEGTGRDETPVEVVSETHKVEEGIQIEEQEPVLQIVEMQSIDIAPILQKTSKNEPDNEPLVEEPMESEKSEEPVLQIIEPQIIEIQPVLKLTSEDELTSEPLIDEPEESDEVLEILEPQIVKILPVREELDKDEPIDEPQKEEKTEPQPEKEEKVETPSQPEKPVEKKEPQPSTSKAGLVSEPQKSDKVQEPQPSTSSEHKEKEEPQPSTSSEHKVGEPRPLRRSPSRLARATSVPRNLEAAVKKKSIPKRRASAESPPRSSKRLAVVLEPIKEDPVPKTPTRRTRKDSTASAGTPNVVTRSASRRLSVESGGGDTGTPSRRVTRATSRETTPLKSSPARRVVRAASSQTSDDARSGRSSVQTRAMAQKLSAKSASQQSLPEMDMDEYASNRRLTRKQRAVLERMMPKRDAAVEGSDKASEGEGGDVSDSESIASNVSNVSSTKSSRKSSTSKRGRPRKRKGTAAASTAGDNLEVIPEAD